MVANKNLKDDLRKRLKISQPTLYAKAKEVRDTIDMEVDESIYLFALMNGIKLGKYLDKDTVNRIRDLQLKYNTSANANLPAKANSTVRRKGTEQPYIIKMPSGVVIDDPLLPRSIIQDAKRMAAIYPWFYYLENSIRSFVCAAMAKYEGTNWWNKVNSKLQNKVAGRKKIEEKNRWHQKRGDREVDYLDLSELKAAISNKARSRLVEDGILPKGNWLDILIDEVYESRCVIAHMNPLIRDSIDAVKVKVKQWNRQVKAISNDLN
jgi:hypothetical protein